MTSDSSSPALPAPKHLQARQSLPPQQPPRCSLSRASPLIKGRRQPPLTDQDISPRSWLPVTIPCFYMHSRYLYFTAGALPPVPSCHYSPLTPTPILLPSLHSCLLPSLPSLPSLSELCMITLSEIRTPRLCLVCQQNAIN
jgi:hypothetical protein